MKNIYYLFFFLLIFQSCKKDKSDAKSVLSFSITSAANPFLKTDIHGSINDDTITVILPNDTTSKFLTPTIQISSGASITPANNQKENFSAPVIYHVTADDGSSANYTVICKTSAILPSTAQLKKFKINGADCAFDSGSGTFYYPVSLGITLNNYTVSFDSTAAASLSFGNIKTLNGGIINYPLSTNHQIKLTAFDKFNKPVVFNLVITGVPIVELTAPQAIGDAKVSAALNLINPDYQTEGSQLEISSDIMISIRGGTSRAYPKNSYLVGLVDGQGNDSDVSLLGLRTDNSWILDAMYIDQARMRNRVCTDIWNSYNNVPYIASEPTALNGTRGYMSEVFINNQYWGVYCLTEKVDRKQLQIKKSYGDMYKAIDWGPQVEFTGVIPFDNTSETWGTWQFEYPDIGDTPAPDWSYLYNIVNFVATSSDSDFINQIASKVDLNNMADYFILINIFGASDNSSKNTYFSFYDYRFDESFFYSAWDLDGSLGRFADGTYIPVNTPLIGWGNNNLLERLIGLNPDNFRQLVKTRWESLENNKLSTTAINARIDNYRDILLKTNAFTRESARWGNITQDLTTETNYMSSWYSTEHDMMDALMNEYF